MVYIEHEQFNFIKVFMVWLFFILFNGFIDIWADMGSCGEIEASHKILLKMDRFLIGEESVDSGNGCDIE